METLDLDLNAEFQNYYERIHYLYYTYINIIVDALSMGFDDDTISKYSEDLQKYYCQLRYITSLISAAVEKELGENCNWRVNFTKQDMIIERNDNETKA